MPPSGGGFPEYKASRTTFDASLFTQPSYWHFRVEFKDADGRIVDITGNDFRIHSFFVLPESSLGIIALLGSSLGTAGWYAYMRARKHQ